MMIADLEASLRVSGVPRWCSGKESTANEGDLGSVPGSGRSLEKEMATHSSILAQETPWTEEPGDLQSIESQRVGFNLLNMHTRKS